MNDSLRMFCTLTGCAALCGLLLASVNLSTKTTIADQRIRYQSGPAIKKAMRDVTNDPVTDRTEVAMGDAGAITLFLGKKETAIVKIGLETEAKGYSGSVGVVTVFSCSTGTIEALEVARSTETPGIGSKVSGETFLRQFMALDTAAALRKDGGTIDGISGATISSGAVCKAVAEAQLRYKKCPVFNRGDVQP